MGRLTDGLPPGRRAANHKGDREIGLVRSENKEIVATICGLREALPDEFDEVGTEVHWL